LVKIYAKNIKFGYLNQILGKLGVTHDLGCKAHGWLCIRFNWTFYYILWFWSYEAKCAQLSCFQRGSTSLHSNFTWIGLFPSHCFWHQKARNTGLPDGEDRILCIQSFWHNTRVRRTDGHRDRRTDLP